MVFLALYINARRLHARAFLEFREFTRCKTARYMEETMNPDQIPDYLVIDTAYCDAILAKRSDYKERLDVYGGEAYDAMEQLILQVLPGALLKTFIGKKLDTLETIVELGLLTDMVQHPAWEETQRCFYFNK